MSQHDFDIANQTAPNARADINNALKALASVSSGASAPSTTYANMLYYNTTDNILYKRNEADSAWIPMGTVDEVNSKFTPSGERAIASQAQAEAGVDNTTLMTPLRTAQAIEELAVEPNPSAGDVVIQKVTPQGIVVSLDSITLSGSGVGTKSETYYSALPVFTAKKSGSVRIKLTLSGVTGTKTFDIYKNGSITATVSTTLSSAALSTDITIAAGDCIHFGGSFTYNIGSSGGTVGMNCTNLTINADAFVTWKV